VRSSFSPATPSSLSLSLSRHVVNEHWLKNKDLFYSFGSNLPLYHEMAPYHSFIMSHLDEKKTTLLEGQLESSLDRSVRVIYMAEDFRFSINLSPAYFE
jgi:hypothetical protein